MALFFALLIFTLTAFAVFADENQQKQKGDDAPEVPFALVYPAVALAGYGAYRLYRRRS